MFVTNLPRVTVLLASYNGSQFIEQQIDSVLSSEGVDVNVIVRDDCSTDNTAEKVGRYGDRVTLIERDRDSSDYGHLANFSALCDYALANTDSDYYAFCDQDDVWLPQKLMLLVQLIRHEKLPALAHSDLRVVDESLKEIAPSFWRHQGLPNPQTQRLAQLMTRNVVTGCACLFNRSLLEKATPIPSQALVHDFWFALVAEATGKVYFLDEPLVLYRQHGKNSIGSTSIKEQESYFHSYLYRMATEYPRNVVKMQLQAAIVYEQLSEISELGLMARLHKLSLCRRITTGSSLLLDKNARWDKRIYVALVLLVLPLMHRESKK